MKSERMRTAAFSFSGSIHVQRLHANYANINININTNYNIIFNYNTMAAAALRAASGHRKKQLFICCRIRYISPSWPSSRRETAIRRLQYSRA